EVENDVDMLRAVTDMEIPKPSSIRPGIPPRLDEIALHALERDPARRFPTARELGRQLVCLLAEERMAGGLAELSDFGPQLFPNGALCARQRPDPVERMDYAAPGDESDHPTVASPLSVPTPIARIAVDGGSDQDARTRIVGGRQRGADDGDQPTQGVRRP